MIKMKTISMADQKSEMLMNMLGVAIAMQPQRQQSGFADPFKKPDCHPDKRTSINTLELVGTSGCTVLLSPNRPTQEGWPQSNRLHWLTDWAEQNETQLSWDVHLGCRRRRSLENPTRRQSPGWPADAHVDSAQTHTGQQPCRLGFFFCQTPFSFVVCEVYINFSPYTTSDQFPLNL